jgi:hypothetical protein
MGKLTSIDDEGNLTWHCTSQPHALAAPCNALNMAHISHEAIQFAGFAASAVSLPPCPVCGARPFLKVVFTEEELAAPNMLVVFSEYEEARLAELNRLKQSRGLDDTQAKEQAQLLWKQQQQGPTSSRAVAERHMQLAAQMSKIGKTPHAGGAP